jgi:hypothetical protein
MSRKLTISIPTYNRSDLLIKCINSIYQSFLLLNSEQKKLVSILISDNSDNLLSNQKLDENRNTWDGLEINYLKNEKNIGSDRNIAQSFYIPDSEFVFLIGDDDQVSPMFLTYFFEIILVQRIDLIFLKYFGLHGDEINNRKDKKLKTKSYRCSSDIILDRQIYLTFISGVIYRRDLYTQEEVISGVGTSLVQTNLIFLILNKSVSVNSIFVNNNVVGVLRNNSGGYNPIDIFLKVFFEVLAKYENINLSLREKKELKLKILRTFYIRSFSSYFYFGRSKLSSGDNFNLDYYLFSEFNSPKIYPYLLRNPNILSFRILTFVSVIWNVYYYPSRIFDYIYHLRNIFIKKTL